MPELLLGLHGSARLGNSPIWPLAAYTDGDKALTLEGQPGARAHLLMSYTRPEDVRWLREHGVGPFDIRLNDMGDFPNLERWYAEGLTDAVIQIGNEPNHPIEPWRGDLGEFRPWYNQATAFIRQHMPTWRVCFPGLSPSYSPAQALTYLFDEVKAADVVGVHLYYQGGGQHIMLPAQMLAAIDPCIPPNKERHLTEYCCTAGESGPVRPTAELAVEYLEFARWLQAKRPDFTRAFFYILGGDPHWQDVGEVLDGTIVRALATFRAEGQPMPQPSKAIAVAICPSLQEYNTYPYAPGNNEWGAMTYLAALIGEACTTEGVAARVFNGAADGPSETANLVKQTDAANAWLTERTEGVKICVHLHSDSGTRSHTWGIWAERFPTSEGFADELAKTVQDVLETAEMAVFSKRGGVDFNTYIFATHAKHPPVLLELFSHQNKRDTEAVWARSGQLATALAQTFAKLGGVTPPDPCQIELAAIKDLARKARDLLAGI